MKKVNLVFRAWLRRSLTESWPANVGVPAMISESPRHAMSSNILDTAPGGGVLVVVAVVGVVSVVSVVVDAVVVAVGAVVVVVWVVVTFNVVTVGLVRAAAGKHTGGAPFCAGLQDAPGQHVMLKPDRRTAPHSPYILSWQDGVPVVVVRRVVVSTVGVAFAGVAPAAWSQSTPDQPGSHAPLQVPQPGEWKPIVPLRPHVYLDSPWLATPWTHEHEHGHGQPAAGFGAGFGAGFTAQFTPRAWRCSVQSTHAPRPHGVSPACRCVASRFASHTTWYTPHAPPGVASPTSARAVVPAGSAHASRNSRRSGAAAARAPCVATSRAMSRRPLAPSVQSARRKPVKHQEAWSKRDDARPPRHLVLQPAVFQADAHPLCCGACCAR